MVNTIRWVAVLLLVAASACGGASNGEVTVGSGGSSGNGSGGASGSGGARGNGSGGSSGNGSGGSDSIDAAGTGGSDNGGTGGDNGGSGGSGGDNGGDEGSGGVKGSGGSAPDGGETDVPVTPGASGLPRASTIENLDDDQRPTLCDWWNMKQGGYSQSNECGGRSEVTDRDQDECVEGLDACLDATVGDFEDCGTAIGTDLCMFRTAAACAKLAVCFPAGGGGDDDDDDGDDDDDDDE